MRHDYLKKKKLNLLFRETSCVNIDTDVCASGGVIEIALVMLPEARLRQSKWNGRANGEAHEPQCVSSPSKERTIDKVDIAALCLPPVVTAYLLSALAYFIFKELIWDRDTWISRKISLKFPSGACPPPPHEIQTLYIVCVGV